MLTIRNQNGSTLIFVLSLVVILNIIIAAVFFSSRITSSKAGVKQIKTSAFNIAEAGKEHCYAAVSSRNYIPDTNVGRSVFTDQPFQNGFYSVSCKSNVTRDSLWVSSTGAEAAETTLIQSIARIAPDIQINFPPVRGAVTSRSRITVFGNIEIDGRDHDTSDNLLATGGTFGVSTCDSLFLKGSAEIGGNTQAPVDNKIFDSVRTIVSQEKAIADSTFDSPENFMGLPPGSLDAYKTGTLTTPFRGLYYDTCSYVGPLHFYNSYGILIVHNASRTAELKINNGRFVGLIITDRMAKIDGNALILGAVVTLSPSDVSTWGTGTALIHYSKTVLENLASYCNNLRTKVTEISWKEVAR